MIVAVPFPVLLAPAPGQSPSEQRDHSFPLRHCSSRRSRAQCTASDGHLNWLAAPVLCQRKTTAITIFTTALAFDAVNCSKGDQPAAAAAQVLRNAADIDSNGAPLVSRMLARTYEFSVDQRARVVALSSIRISEEVCK